MLIVKIYLLMRKVDPIVWPKMKRFNTLRNQMLVGFLGVMVIILTFVGIMTYDSVSTLLKNNAQKHFQQTAVQANGRLEALLEQIDSLTTQVATDSYIQNLLLDETNGKSATFSERQSLLPIVSMVQAYSSGVSSVELYNYQSQRIFPMNENSLENRVERSWIEKAGHGKGKLVWIGIDPQDSNSVLAIRRISLIEQYYSHGGYLLVRMNRNAFELEEQIPLGVENTKDMTLLVDNQLRPIASNNHFLSKAELETMMQTDEQTVTFKNKNYIIVRQQSTVTDWTLLMLTPVSTVTEGISVLRTAVIASGGIGTFLFIILSLILSTMITRPIFKLIKTMRRVRLGTLQYTKSPSSTIEINELTQSYNLMVDDMNSLIRLVYEKELLQSRMELKALQAQIDPHFLFNTLEMFYWSLQEKEEEELAELVVAMSGLFRYTIGNPKKDEWVTIAQEIEHVERYLTIMKMRYGDRLTWHISSKLEFSLIKLPKLIIQPLVENAIVHGIEDTLNPVSISVSITRSASDDHLIVEVQDDGPGMSEETISDIIVAMEEGQMNSSARGTGVGITSVHRRLMLNFERNNYKYGLNITSKKDVGTAIRFEIPMQSGGM